MNPSLGDVADLAVQLERDADEPHAALHQRDRRLLAGLAELPADSGRRLLVWLDRMRAAGEELPGRRVSAGYRLLLAALVVSGAVFGGTVASVVFHYDGVRPVNVVHVLAVFVVAQIALLALVGVVMLPGSWLGRIPGAASLQQALATLSPGQAMRLLRRRLPERVRQAAWAGEARLARHWRPFEPVWKWAGLFGAQTFAVSFNLSAVAAGLYLVTFSDLAFAWSTTLRPDIERVHRLTQAAAVPWSRLVPAAVPSLDLIRSTLYYRHEAMTARPRPEGWGGWWPFLLAAMVAYGALPRVGLLAWSGWNLRRALREAMVDSPGARVVLERLDASWVSTQATVEEAGTPTEPGAGGEAGRVAFPGGRRLHPINWGGLPLEDAALRRQLARHCRGEIGPVRHAGGSAPMAVDEETIARLAEAPEDEALAVLAKGWEPPLLECLDFLKALRAASGARRLVVVLPVALDNGGQLRACAEGAFQVWQRKLRSLADPALSVNAWPEAAMVANGGAR